MRFTIPRGAAGLTALLALACGGDGGSGPSPSDLAGTWQASSVQYVSSTGLGTVDIVAGGATVTLVLGSNGSFDLTIVQAGVQNGTFSGTYAMNGVDLMVVHPGGGPSYFPLEFSRSGNTITLACGPSTGAGGGDNCAFCLKPGMQNGYDFNHDGTLEHATWRLTLHR